jgi:hypothetical protein
MTALPGPYRTSRRGFTPSWSKWSGLAGRYLSSGKGLLAPSAAPVRRREAPPRRTPAGPRAGTRRPGG